jgi:murein DD-endopeptidase MepM/ murein hydrolase activator NlpD
VKKSYKPSMNRFFASVKRRKQKFDYRDGIICIVAFTVLTIGTIFMGTGKSKIYEVKVNNKFIGYINKYDTYKSAIEGIKAIDKTATLKEVIAEKTDNVVETFITTTTIENAISKELGVNMPSVSIKSNGTEIAVVASKDDAKKVLDGVIKQYYPKIDNGKVTVTSSKILEKVSLVESNADPKNILSVTDAIKKIVGGRGAQEKYVIKNGDTLWDVAIANNLGIEDIKAANPKINLDKIKINQVINLAVNLPYVNVRITANIDSKEQIPFESKTIIDKKAKRGANSVKERGSNGLAEIIKTVIIENGNIIDENVKSTKTIYAAKDRVLVIGGKVPIYAATGSFIKPSRGRLSSPFGRRWGKMHEGIDLAGPTGSPIDAADSGKVSFVGIRNGYGLCVMINHGNGLQTLYGHTSKTFVKEGQSVKKGQRIASVGSTGHSTGPHLHFEVRKNGVPVNPFKYMK